MTSRVLFLAILLVVVSTMPPVSAQQEDSISLDVPSSVTAGATAEITGHVSLRDRPGTWETTVQVTLKVDGSVVATRDVTVTDGETTTVSFSHSFDSPGTHTVIVTGSASFGSYSYERSAETSLTVEAAGDDDVSASTPDVTTPNGPTQSVEGAIFPVPAGLQDEVSSYRAKTDGLAPHAVIVATESTAYIAFTSEPLEKGAGSVTGRVLSEDALTVDGITFGAMVVSSADLQENPRRVAVGPLAEPPNDYALEEVAVEAHHSVAAVRHQPEAGGDIDSPGTLGVLTQDSAAHRNLTGAAATAVFNPSAEPLPDASPRVFTQSTRRGFWANGEATVSGVVLPPGTTAREVVTTFDASGITARADGEVLLSVTTVEQQARQVQSVESLVSGDVPGTMVRVESNMIQTRVSTQELLMQTTPCGDTKVPVKEVCVPVPSDVLVHSGVAWDASVESTEQAIVILGASSRVQEEIVTAQQGRYRITGRMVSLQTIDGRLPDRRALLVTDLERVGAVQGSVPTGIIQLREQVNTTMAGGISVDASASASVVAESRQASTEDGESGGETTETPTSESDGGVGAGPLPVDGPGFGAGSAMGAIILLALMTRIRYTRG